MGVLGCGVLLGCVAFVVSLCVLVVYVITLICILVEFGLFV